MLFDEVHYRCITQLHIGCGQDVGIVDLPVIRERLTGFPFAPGSGTRGALRARVEALDPAAAERLFGSDDPNKISAGCVAVLDAHLLLFPVRSAPHVFVWLTCPFVLQRLASQREYFRNGAAGASPPTPPEDRYLGAITGPLWLEEYPFEKGDQPWQWSETVDGVDNDRVVLVSNQVFAHFTRNATIVTQHNKLTSAKTVEKGMLFSVESLPPETILYGFLGFMPERTLDAQRWDSREVRSTLRDRLVAQGSATHLILGGDEATGLGMTKLIFVS